MQVSCISEFSPPPRKAFILLLKALPNLGAISGEQLAKESVPKILRLPGSRPWERGKKQGKKKGKWNTCWSPWHLIFLGSMSRVSHPRLGFNWRILFNWGLFALCTTIPSRRVPGAVPFPIPGTSKPLHLPAAATRAAEMCLLLKFSCLSVPAPMRGVGILGRLRGKDSPSLSQSAALHGQISIVICTLQAGRISEGI